MLPVSDFKNLKKEKKTLSLLGQIKLKVLITTAIVVFGLVFVQMVFASAIATDGEKLSALQKEIAQIEAQNITLKAQIAQISSLTYLSTKAQVLGFNKPKVITP